MNCGLHDIKRNPATRKIRIEKEQYRQNLEEIFKRIKKKNIQTIWICITPEVDSIHNKPGMAFYWYNDDVLAYNKIANEICLRNRIPIIDLYSFTEKLGPGEYSDLFITKSIHAPYRPLILLVL